MSIKIFGGQKGTLFHDYLQHQKRGIYVQLLKQIEAGADEKTAKKEVRKMFLVQNLKFLTSEAKITETGASKNGERMKEGRLTKAFLVRYSYSLPFTGESNALEFRPQTFHGSDAYADVSGSYSDPCFYLTVDFFSEKNNQAEFDHHKSTSFGDYHENCNEINKEIDEWNKDGIDQAIDQVYPIALDEVEKTRQFDEKNKIGKR